MTDMEQLQSLIDKGTEYEGKAHGVSFYLDRCQGSWEQLKDKSVLSEGARELMADGLAKIYAHLDEAEALAENIAEQIWHLERKERAK